MFLLYTEVAGYALTFNCTLELYSKCGETISSPRRTVLLIMGDETSQI